jgi:hypothetical protein
MLTRRQWLQTNPRPKSPVNLQALLDQEQHAANEQQSQLTPLYAQVTVANQAGRTADAAALNKQIAEIKARQDTTAKNIAQLKTEIAAAVKCPVHQIGLHFHRNRPEDLYICENGPHFLFWTLLGGKPQLVAVPTLMLPGLDFPMTEGTKISRAEWLSQHQPQTITGCPEHKITATKGEQLLPAEDRPVDVFVCGGKGEKYLWTKTPNGAGFVPMPAALPALDQPIE